MRKTLLRAKAVTVSLGIVVGVPGCQPRPALPLPAVADTATTLYEISNLKVIHRFIDASDIVVVRLYLLGGTRQLTEENAGIEFLLLRAAGLESSDAFAHTGSHPVLDPTPDWTVTGFVGLRKHLDSAWTGLADQLVPPQFSDASLERVRGELVTIARRRYTQPDQRIRSGAQRAAFRGHPYALDPEGTAESLTAISRADLERYWDEHFTTSRMLLVVVGPITRAKVESLVTTTLGQLPTGRYEWTLPAPIPQRPSSWLAEHQRLPTNYIMGYFGGPSPTDPDYFSFRVAVALLSSAIHERVRERNLLSYVAGAPFLDLARPIGGIYTSTSHPAEAITIIRQTISEYGARMPVSIGQPYWWRPFVNSFALGELMARLTSEGQAETLARAYLYFGDIGMADEIVSRLRQVDFRSMSDVIRKYVQDVQYAYMGDTALMEGKW